MNTTSPSYLLDVHGSANVETLRASLPLATTASNVAVFDPATRELLDSNGMVSNKFSVVSEMPSEDLTAASSLVTNFGKFKVESATMATGSNAWNAFNSTASWHWKTASTYNGTDALYNGSTRITSSVEFGEYLVIEPTQRRGRSRVDPGRDRGVVPRGRFHLRVEFGRAVHGFDVDANRFVVRRRALVDERFEDRARRRRRR